MIKLYGLESAFVNNASYGSGVLELEIVALQQS